MVEKAVADFKGCGAGKGSDCCIFFIVGRNGPECARFSSAHDTLVARQQRQGMVAQRLPTEPFPNCQLPAKEVDL